MSPRRRSHLIGVGLVAYFLASAWLGWLSIGLRKGSWRIRSCQQIFVQISRNSVHEARWTVDRVEIQPISRVPGRARCAMLPDDMLPPKLVDEIDIDIQRLARGGWPLCAREETVMHVRGLNLTDEHTGLARSVVAEMLRAGQLPWPRALAETPRLRYTRPLAMLFNGLVTLTAFLAIPALVPGMWFLRGAIRARRRAKAGLCLGCGYDLQGLQVTVCPECGRATAAIAPTPSSTTH
jgi:hypothetical protein